MAHYIRSDWSIHNEAPGRKIPTAAVFVIAPLMGAAFLMFMPALVFYLVGKAAIEESAKGMASIARLFTRKA